MAAPLCIPIWAKRLAKASKCPFLSPQGQGQARPFPPHCPKTPPSWCLQLGPAQWTFSIPAAWDHLAFAPTLPPRRNPTARLEEWQPLCITKTSASWWESGAKTGPERRPIFSSGATRPDGRARPGWGRGLGGRGPGPGPGSGAGPESQIPEAQLSGAAG